MKPINFIRAGRKHVTDPKGFVLVAGKCTIRGGNDFSVKGETSQ